MVACSTCGLTHAHSACHAAATTYPGNWHCPECVTNPAWEQSRWEVSMQAYNAQRQNDKHTQDAHGKLFPCDTAPRGTPGSVTKWTQWEAFKQYALDPTSPADPYLYFAIYDEQDTPAKILSGHISTCAVSQEAKPKGRRRQQPPANHQHQPLALRPSRPPLAPRTMAWAAWLGAPKPASTTSGTPGK